VRHRVFASFQYEDVHYARLLEAWAANENHDFALYSERLRVAVNSARGTYIRQQLRPRIARASVLLCLIGEGTWSSRWVKWEIETAKVEGKGLVGVQLRPASRVPVALRNCGGLFVPFKQAKIERAIAERAKTRPTTRDWKYR
jgi:hypothetical protein